MKRSANSFSNTDVPCEQSNVELINLIPQIRNTTRAIIVHNRHILLLRKEYDDGKISFAFPGGGQEAGETLIQALNRECVEEIGVEVKIGNLVHVADCFKLRNTVPSSTRHLVEFFFECAVPDNYIPRNGYRPDKHQVEVVWKDIRQLAEAGFFLPVDGDWLADAGENNASVYLGKIV